MYLMENAVGAVIVVSIPDVNNVPIDLSTASVKELIFKKPNGEVVTKPGTIANPPGTDGKLMYSTAAGDLTPAGTWKVQGYVVRPDLDSRGRQAVFFVYRNL